jgi:hypothetical protein
MRSLERTGTCTAEILNAQSLGMRDEQGRDIYALAVRVIGAGSPAHHVQIASHVPGPGLALLAPGAVLPAAVIPNGDEHDVVIDWPAALAQPERADRIAPRLGG